MPPVVDRLASSSLSARSKASIRKLGLDTGGGITSPELGLASPPLPSARKRTPSSSSSPGFSHRHAAVDVPSPPVFEVVSEVADGAADEFHHQHHHDHDHDHHAAEHEGHQKHQHHGQQQQQQQQQQSKTKDRVERVLAEQADKAEGGAQRSALLEAGAHLWLAEELRGAAAMLQGQSGADPRACSERLDELSRALQVEACTQRWKGGDGAYGGEGGVAHASRAASMVHRATQLRHVAKAVLEYATALRHGGARGWVNIFGAGGIDACNPTVVPTLLSLADSETALARVLARPQSRGRAHDHAHAPLRGATKHAAPAYDAASSPVANTTRTHSRRRLAAANEDLFRDASLVADAPTLLPPQPPDHTTIALRVLAGGGYANGLPSGLGWSGKQRRQIADGGAARVSMWGSTINPQHGGAWLGAGWRWRGGLPGGDDSSEDEDAEMEREREEAAKRARKALRLAKRLSRSWEPEKGVCVRCVEREVGQAPTFLAR